MDARTRKEIRERLSMRSGIYGVDILDAYPFKELDYHAPLGLDASVPLGNMSFCNIGNNRRLVSVRQFNYLIYYKLLPGEKPGMPLGFFGGRNYFFIITDSDFNFVRRVECDMPELWALEDIRLMSLEDNIIQASATDISAGPEKYRMCVKYLKMADVDSDGPSRLVPMESVAFPNIHEKNYIPMPNRGMFISDLCKNSMIVIDGGNMDKRVWYCGGIRPYRGSSQLLKYGDGYVALVHHKIRNDYINAFVFFNKDMTLCHISKNFVVGRHISPINFLCGMSIENDKAVLPFCVNDRWTYLFRLPLKDFMPK